MKRTPKKNYLKGKTVFVVSILVILATFLTVWLTGINYNRAITANLYLSLSIIGLILFLFMAYGLYKGVGLQDDFPKYKSYKAGDLFAHDINGTFKTPDADVGAGIGGLLLSIVLWIVMTLALIVLMLLLEALFWFSLFIIILMLYWVFFRALKLVFTKSNKTQGNLLLSISYSLTYTVLYLGWIFGIVFLSTVV
ncbi:hypothetical protein [Leeuwenhoekiella nanhaiensis]|uniref:Uncharacterized protein n=1 Tax=Leeuwenhoekiella nanhaiensis TaxID=1655491 RepID=A0A2G1VTU1_9FLAO|nr:hypothetical protein [Leeuwenhoekiella nanhaiensis]PHQ29859.1 hypothetical protein CJ305_07775 [Leeuwenhoekiella nanhaiensis]